MFPVVFVSTIDWNQAWQRHQTFAAAFAERGRRVFFIGNTGLRNPGPGDARALLRKAAGLLSRAAGPAQGNPTAFSPMVLPPTWGLFRRMNAAIFIPRLIGRLRAAGLSGRPLVVAGAPTRTALDLIARLDPAGIVYDCSCNFRAIPGAPADLAATEAELLRRSGAVIVDSEFLFLQKKKEHPSVHRIHHGVSPDFFIEREPPARPRACFFGTLHDGLDYEGIRAVAEAGVPVDLIGPVKHPVPDLGPAVAVLPPVPHAALPARLGAYSAFLLPYAATEFNSGVVPAKLYECLATGRPVIASPLPSLKAFEGLIRFAHSPGEWAEIALALRAPENAGLAPRRRAEARKALASAQFEKYLAVVREVMGGAA